MNYAFRNGKILDGTKEMKIQQGLCILVENGIITELTFTDNTFFLD